MDEKQRSGTCYCGEVSVTATGKPLSVSICHCTTCQQLGGSPFGVQSLHRPANFTINKPPEDLWSLQSSKNVTRYRCQTCGSPVYATLNGGKIFVVPRSILFQDKNIPGDNEDDDYRPKHHMYYGSRIFDVNDDLPKYVGTSHATRGVLWTENQEDA
jgi:hypothetical protein